VKSRYNGCLCLSVQPTCVAATTPATAAPTTLLAHAPRASPPPSSSDALMVVAVPLRPRRNNAGQVDRF